MTVPRVTVGIPVRNGAEKLGRAVASVMAQTFTDFELIIVDNASTDNTADICRLAERDDERVRYLRQKSDVGAAANFNHALAMARGEYFCWLAHDDWFAPTYLEKCLTELDADDSLVLVAASMGVTDRAGEVFREHFEALSGMEDPRARTRLHRIMWSLRDPTGPIFGVSRTSTLRKLGGVPAVPEPDRNLLYALSLEGEFRAIPELLFFHFAPLGHMAHYGTGKMSRRSWDWIHAPGSRKVKAAPLRVMAYMFRVVATSDLSATDTALAWVDISVATVVQRARSKTRRTMRRLRERSRLLVTRVERGR